MHSKNLKPFLVSVENQSNFLFQKLEQEVKRNKATEQKYLLVFQLQIALKQFPEHPILVHVSKNFFID